MTARNNGLSRGIDGTWPLIVRAGFTFPELLIILVVLSILIALLLPVFGKVREKAREVQCQSNLRQLHAGFIYFATEHDRRLPGSIADQFDPDPDHHDWLMGDPHDFRTAPQGGTVFKYVHDQATFRCPSTTPNPPKPGALFGPFNGSNGRFDFAAIEAFSGARAESVPGSCRVARGDGQYDFLPTPLLVEKDAALINGAQLNGAHTSNFPMSHHHHLGAYYAAVDGSAQWVNELQSSTNPRGCQLWECISPAGQWTSLGSIRAHWGSWDTQ